MGLTKTLNGSSGKSDDSRDTAAGFLSSTATHVRDGSKAATRVTKKATKVIARGANGLADSLDGAAERVGRNDRRLSLPRPLLLIFGLLAVAIAIVMVRRVSARYESDFDEDDF